MCQFWTRLFDDDDDDNDDDDDDEQINILHLSRSVYNSVFYILGVFLGTEALSEQVMCLKMVAIESLELFCAYMSRADIHVSTILI